MLFHEQYEFILQVHQQEILIPVMRAPSVLTEEIQCGNSVKIAQKETTAQKVHPIQRHVQRKFY